MAASWPPQGPYYITTIGATEAAAQYDACAPTYDIMSAHHEGDITEIIRLIEPQSRMRCLDLGCGTGMMTFALKEKVGKGLVVGVDCSGGILKAAEARGGRLGIKGVQFRVGDITDPACVEMISKHFAGSYDIITLIWVISQVPLDKQASTLRMWAALLNPGGRLVVERSNSRHDEDTGEVLRVVGIPASIQTKYSLADDASYHLCRTELEQLAAAAGLDVVSSHRYFINYVDRNVTAAKAAREEWTRRNGTELMPRNFLLQFKQDMLKADMGVWTQPEFAFKLKNVSMVAILQLAGSGGN